MLVPAGTTLHVGDRIAVTDDDADTVEAVVMAQPTDGRVEIRILWDVIVARAE